MMKKLEALLQHYLFKLKCSKYVKELLHKHHCLGEWTVIRKGREAIAPQLTLEECWCHILAKVMD
jgi:hypothetical protein